MPFKKLFDKVTSALSTTGDFLGDSFNSMLSKKYPDIDEVFETLREMRQSYDSVDSSFVDENEDGKSDNDDDKWRPLILSLGLLYKLQRIQDSHPGSWYNRSDIFVHDDDEESRLLNVFGFYWHTMMKVAGALRTIEGGNDVTEDDEQAYINVTEATGLTREEVLFAHATDSLHVDEHCPDCAVLLLHQQKQILVVICGTRMIPSPKMKDVFMDLYADSAPFLHGEAHMGEDLVHTRLPA